MKQHPIKKMLLRLSCLILIFTGLLFVVKNNNVSEVRADDEEIIVKPMEKPNRDVVKILGIWLTNGYSLQPESDYYTQVGQTVIIRTSAGRSVWSVLTGLLDSPHYRWYKTTDAGETWSAVPESEGGYRMNFPVTPKEIGTTWYQLDTQYWNYLTGWLAKTHIYSQVTAVHAKEPVNATELTITTDDDYLYNLGDNDLANNDTYVHAHPIPSDANGQMTYTVDKPEIADFSDDKENGGKTTQLIAKKGAIGTVTITGTMQNPNGSKISAQTSVRVGGGLDDQTVNIGETATYTMYGDTVGDDESTNKGKITIEWFKYDKKGKSTSVAKSTTSNYKDYISYTTPATTMDDDGTKYQAKITFKYGTLNLQTKTMTTNQANLTVINKPDITVENTVTNDSYSGNDDDEHNLNDVSNDDVITYHSVITENSDRGVLKDGYYVIPMHKSTKINSVKLDDAVIDSSKYSIVPNSEDNTDDLVISGLDFDGVDVRVHSVEVSTTVAGVTGTESLTYTPYIYGNSNDDEVYMSKGITEQINYTLDGFIVSIQDLHYGAVNSFNTQSLQYREDKHNLPNGNVVEVNDRRRDKKGKKAYVKQERQFENENGDQLSSSIRYYDNDSYVSILNNKTFLKETQAGESFDSIGWGKKDGLLLYLDDAVMKAGTYNTTLTWVFEDTL
ncbi:hypothetical protein [Companilactobacillus jidongensis]|uniref:hypothetical protein n=1 Tax=Companilactobacillus jidongensis TaxID=2486006 RepID=UPI000F79490B|nr:hypothetical protein [Companilactobacillus jidongensis]